MFSLAEANIDESDPKRRSIDPELMAPASCVAKTGRHAVHYMAENSCHGS
jgi:hypothetical protein